MPDSRGRETRIRIAAVTLLAFTAGWVDAVGFMSLYQLFVAHMSGNSIVFNVAIGEGRWREALHRGFPIPVFLTGVMLGMIVNELFWRRGVRSIFAASLLFEALCLLGFAIFGQQVMERGRLPRDPWWKFYSLAALPVLAMGVQNATFKRAAGNSVRTTYVSGLLTDAVERSVEYAFNVCNPSADKRLPDRDFGSPSSAAKILLLVGLWFAYAAGGLSGAVAEIHWRLDCLAAPIGCLLLVAACDLAYQLAPPPAEG